MKRVKRENITLALGTVMLAVITAAAFSVGLKLLPQSSLLRVGAFLCAPKAALAAERNFFYKDAQAVPAAQTIDENDYSSGFWTQQPTKEEIKHEPPLQSQTQQEPQAQMPSGFAPIVSAEYDKGSGVRYIQCGASTIKNCTKLPAAEVAAEVLAPLSFNIEINSQSPQVLIMHTHATETYQLTPEPWCDPAFSARTTDNSLNMTSVGAAMTQRLNEAGINTIHDETLHDYPSYTGSYERSNKTVRAYLEKYPSIKIVLDVHRDAIQKEDGTRIKPVCTVNGQQTAQVMIICGANKNNNIPNFKQNLRFASAWQNKMEQLYPSMTRPVLFDYRYYNQDLTTGSLLLEVGGHANTLQEATNAGINAADALAKMFLEK